MPGFLFLAIATAAASASASPLVLPVPRSPCIDQAVPAAIGDRRADIRPLGQQADARQFLAVVREIDGCRKPVVVKERVGFQRR